MQTNHRTVPKVILIALIWLSFGGVPPLFGDSSPARIAVLTPGLAYTPVHKGLQDGLALLGYKEGQNIIFIVEDTQESTAGLPQRADKLLAAKPDVLFTVATAHSMAAKKATAAVPIVFTWVGDPVGAGLVASYACSQNNLTGVTSFMPTLSGKRMEVLLELAPKARRLLTIVTLTENIARSAFQQAEESARKFGVQLVRRDVANRDDIMRVIQETRRGSVDAIYYISSVLMKANFDILVKKAKTDKIPLVVTEDSQVAAGALFSYGADLHQVGMQAAAIVDKILKGVKPDKIVIQTPDKFHLSINVKTAQEIGLKIPRGILERADQLID